MSDPSPPPAEPQRRLPCPPATWAASPRRVCPRAAAAQSTTGARNLRKTVSSPLLPPPLPSSPPLRPAARNDRHRRPPPPRRGPPRAGPQRRHAAQIRERPQSRRRNLRRRAPWPRARHRPARGHQEDQGVGHAGRHLHGRHPRGQVPAGAAPRERHPPARRLLVKEPEPQPRARVSRRRPRVYHPRQGHHLQWRRHQELDGHESARPVVVPQEFRAASRHQTQQSPPLHQRPAQTRRFRPRPQLQRPLPRHDQQRHHALVPPARAALWRKILLLQRRHLLARARLCRAHHPAALPRRRLGRAPAAAHRALARHAHRAQLARRHGPPRLRRPKQGRHPARARPLLLPAHVPDHLPRRHGAALRHAAPRPAEARDREGGARGRVVQGGPAADAPGAAAEEGGRRGGREGRCGLEAEGGVGGGRRRRRRRDGYGGRAEGEEDCEEVGLWGRDLVAGGGGADFFSGLSF